MKVFYVAENKISDFFGGHLGFLHFDRNMSILMCTIRFLDPKNIYKDTKIRTIGPLRAELLAKT